MNFRFTERAVLGAAVVLCLFTGSSSLGQLGPLKHEPKGPWENKSLSPDERADLVIEKMTLDEKIQLLHGLGWEALFGPPPESGPGTRAIRPSGFIPGVPRLGIPDLQMTDAAVGVAGDGDKSRYATALPSAAAMAAGWDPALSNETGTLIGSEVRAQGFNISLGSGINLTRESRDGRIFEYMGEDPLLAGTLAGQALKAVKAQNVVTDVKHYVVNDQEAGRFFVNSVIDKRSMRESDLLAFEIVLRESNPGAVMCAYNKITEKAKGAVVKFDPGTDPVSAAALAKASDVAIVFAVQHTYENMDLPNLSLPENQDALIEAVAAANPHTIVVLETGGPVTMSWIDKVTAVIEAWYPGIRGSEAEANILFGDVNPSGKLPVTFARTEADLPHPRHVDQPALDPNHPITPLPNLPVVPGISTNQTPFDAVYDEGLKVGYKWYDAEKKGPLFPFGFGLSYTTYSYSELKTTSDKGLTVTFTLKNTGHRAGEETAQVYLTLPVSTHEPPRRLVGWSETALGPGEQKDVTVKVDPQMVSIFDLDKNSWEVVPGEYKVWVGRSSRDLPLSATITLGSGVAEAAGVEVHR